MDKSSTKKKGDSLLTEKERKANPLVGTGKTLLEEASVPPVSSVVRQAVEWTDARAWNGTVAVEVPGPVVRSVVVTGIPADVLLVLVVLFAG